MTVKSKPDGGKSGGTKIVDMRTIDVDFMGATSGFGLGIRTEKVEML